MYTYTVCVALNHSVCSPPNSLQRTLFLTLFLTLILTLKLTLILGQIDKGKKSCGPGAHNLPDSSVDKYASTSGQRFGAASKDPYKVRQYLSKHHMKVFLTTESPGPKYVCVCVCVCVRVCV